jgi:hypothetical protein
LWSVARALGGRRPVVEARLQSVAQALGDRRLVVMGDGDETGVGGEEKVGFTWLQRGRMKPAQVPCVLLARLGFGKMWATEVL